MSSSLWLAPMAGISDRAFRHICIEYGAGLTYSEMVSAAGLMHASQKTWQYIEPANNEKSFVVQLFGHEKDVMLKAALEVQKRLGNRLAGIDLNMGCPVRKVVSKGEGSALMKTPELAYSLVETLVKALDVPVSVKFRSGWTNEEITAVEFGLLMQQAGASFVAVHARSARQFYKGKANWEVIADVASALDVPVVGSGDVFSFEDVQNMRAQTGCDAVMVARGARGNPWIFKSSIDKKPYLPSMQERIECARYYLELYCSYYGQEYLVPMRAKLAPFIHGMPQATCARRKLSSAKTRQDFEEVLSFLE